MKRILLLLLLPLLTVLPLLADKTIVHEGVTYAVSYGDLSDRAYGYVSAVDATRDTITIKSWFRTGFGKYGQFFCKSINSGIFDNNKNLRVLYLSLYKSDQVDDEGHYTLVPPLPVYFKGCDNLEEIKETGIGDGYAYFEERGDSALYCKDGLYAFPPKPREFFSTHSDIMAGCFAYCNIRTLKYNVRYIPNNTFLGFKGKIIFTKELNHGDDIFEPLSQLEEESEIDVATWGDHDRACKYYKGKITVNGGETLRILPIESAFSTLTFDLKLFGSTKQSDVRSVTVGDKSLTLNASGRYTIDNLQSGTKYEVHVTYIGEDGTLREQTETLSTKTARNTLTTEFRGSTFVSISFDIHVSNPTTLADIQKVTVGNISVPLTPDGKYVVNNLAPSTSYVVLIEYKGEDGNVRVNDFGYETQNAKLLRCVEFSRYIAGMKAQLKMSDGSAICDLSQSNATYGMKLEGESKYHKNDTLCIDANVSSDGWIKIGGLKPDSQYVITPYIKCGEEYYLGEKYKTVVWRGYPELNCSYYAFPTAIRFFESESESDWSYEAKKAFCYLDEACTRPVPYEMTNLMPYTDYPIWMKIDDPDLSNYVVKRWVRTARINCQFHVDNINNVTPTTAYMYFSYQKAKEFEPELKFVAYWYDEILKTVDESFLMTGLKPATKYMLTFKAIEVSTGKVLQSEETNFTTPPLTLETEAPKIPSAGNMIARATTNISELEPNVGFQWKKYDAPESLKPSEGFAVAYGGVLEGTIHNLQIDHYYNVRAFYRDMNGKEYYGKWITVDPSDFSWFEPNVHTYDVDRVTTNGAKARGYVVQGTDDIEKQGFEYWPSGDSSKRRVAYGAYAPADNGRQTILATGQLMTAELDGLLSDTEYTVRSFVTTSASTYYGEEITFRTLEASGIDAVTVDDAEVVPVAYYRLDGTRGERPFSGLNMVVFSDGHVEKIVFK